VLVLKNLLFTLLVPGMVGGYLPELVSRGRHGEPWLGGLPSYALFTLGAAIYGWCLWDFAAFGRGTPAPIDAPKRLVARGLYRYSRNPMYVGVLAAITGWLLLRPGLPLVLYLAAVATAFASFVRFYEEPALRRLFGDEYVAYCGRVNRWLGRRER